MNLLCDELRYKINCTKGWGQGSLDGSSPDWSKQTDLPGRAVWLRFMVLELKSKLSWRTVVSNFTIFTFYIFDSLDVFSSPIFQFPPHVFVHFFQIFPRTSLFHDFSQTVSKQDLQMKEFCLKFIQKKQSKPTRKWSIPLILKIHWT